MTVRPDFGPEYGDEERQRLAPPPLPEEREEDEEERVIHDFEREDVEPELLDLESNEAHAPGQVCERCGQVIAAGQDARRRPDGHWVHDECPLAISAEVLEGDSGTPE